MADTDLLRVSHPETGGVFETTRKQFDEVWSGKGWVETAPDTPLTDQRYNNEGGGESQPPPTRVPEGSSSVVVEEVLPPPTPAKPAKSAE